MSCISGGLDAISLFLDMFLSLRSRGFLYCMIELGFLFFVLHDARMEGWKWEHRVFMSSKNVMTWVTRSSCRYSSFLLLQAGYILVRVAFNYE